jgi:cytidylate kinase
MKREVSPLIPAPGAVEIDTSELSIQEVLDTVLNIALMRNLM